MLRLSVRTLLMSICLVSMFSMGHAAEPHVVMLVAEQEYRTDESLPAFAKQCLPHCRTSFVVADPQDPNRLRGIEAVDTADVLLVSVRRRTLPKDQLDRIRRHVASGKPLIGIRTASHAFTLRNENPPAGLDSWPEFDREVFGGNYTNHYGNAMKVTLNLVEMPAASSADLLEGIPRHDTLSAGGSLYRVSPLSKGTAVVIEGSVEGHDREPVAWTFRRADGGKSFYTSLGHVDDFHGDVLPQLLANAIAWSLEE